LALERKFQLSNEEENMTSGYYHFNSEGKKIKNKWDSFDVDAELRKVDGTDKRGAAKKSNPSDNTARKEKTQLHSKNAEIAEITGSARKTLGELWSDTERVLSILDTKIRGDEEIKRERKRVASKANKIWKEIETVKEHFLTTVTKQQEAVISSACNPKASEETNHQASRLQGAIGPKRVESEVHMPVRQGASSWNQAGTWEDKDMTVWARERLTELLSQTSVQVPSKEGTDILKATQVRILPGPNSHCTITLVRNRRRFLFEFQVEVDWSCSAGARGTLSLPDLSSDAGGDYEFTLRAVTPAAGGTVEDRAAAERAAREHFFPAVVEKVAAFAAELGEK